MAEKEVKKSTTKKENTKENEKEVKDSSYKVVGKTKSTSKKSESKPIGKVTIEEKAQKQISQSKNEHEKEEKKNKKTSMIIIPVIVAIAIIVTIVVALSGSKISNKIKLDKEIKNVFEGNISDEIKTTGDYAVVESAIKEYHKQFLDSQNKFMDIIADEKIQDMLSVQNCEEDGPEFTKSKEYIQNSKKEFNDLTDTLVNLLNEQAIMSKIEDKNLSDYYINLYKSYFFAGSNLAQVYESVYTEIDATKSLMNSLYDNELKILNFLTENKNHWKVENSQVKFDSPSVSAQYKTLLVQLSAQ